MPLWDNDIAVYLWLIHSCFYGNERRWVCDQVQFTILTYNASARPIIQVPLQVYMICLFAEDWPLEVGFTAVSLVYGMEPSRPSSRRHPPWSSSRLSSLLSHRLSCGTIQHIQGPDSHPTQDYSTRCDVLFPGYIQFTIRVRDVSLIRKCKYIVTMLYHLCTARLYLYSLQSDYSLPGM